MGSDQNEEIARLQRQLEQALAECARLRAENERLRTRLSGSQVQPHTEPQPQAAVSTSPATEPQSIRPPERVSGLGSEKQAQGTSAKVPFRPALASHGILTDDQVALFMSLFRGRDDVYAARWEARDGRAGYSPVCLREWKPGFCRKPQVKCADCESRELAPLGDGVIREHLVGRRTIGIYPLLKDETCWFLAVDFDKAGWRDDVRAVVDAAHELGVPVSIERSRSGNGGHVWIFFETAIPASLARSLGCLVLSKAMETRHQMGLDSYDRLFPNQDTLPKGGFGNLIALPLQRGPSLRGNSLFLDEGFSPYSDQWSYLSSVRKLGADEARTVVGTALRVGGVLGVRSSAAEDGAGDDPWVLAPSKSTGVCLVDDPVKGTLPEKTRIVLSNMVYAEKDGMPQALLSRLTRIAAFQNPEFYKAQAMRLPTYNKPRVISCSEDFPRHIGLPRGCLEDVLALFRKNGIQVDIADEQNIGRPLSVKFRGRLRPDQRDAAKAIAVHETGVLCAGTGFGKTVIGAWLIGARKLNTLILVHRTHLLDQWKERLLALLDAPPEAIGQIGGGKRRPSHIIDIALIQSLNRKGVVDDIVADYGQVIVDECHHLSAFSFEQVMKQVKARYVVGLTATPTRRDGHHPIVMMQCGPIRYRTTPKEQAKSAPFDHVVIERVTDFNLPPDQEEPGIQTIYGLLAEEGERNDLVLGDVLAAVENGRSPLVLTERTDHLDTLAEALRPLVRNLVVLRGGMGVRQRRAAMERLSAIPAGEERVVLATGRYIGEGFDDARLDTLFLAMPIAWRGTLQQYAGRLHRIYDGKQEVQVYDYVDSRVPVLARMYVKRVKGYKALGYSIRK